MRKPPSTITVLIDSREQKPLLFPKNLAWHSHRTKHPQIIRVKESVKTLPAGDYALEGYDDVALIERKGSLSEMAQNMLTKDHSRATAAFQKLIEACEFPYLLLDASIENLNAETDYCPQPARAMQALYSLAAEKGLRILLAGECKGSIARRKLGEMCLTLMLTHAMIEPCGPIDILSMVPEQLSDSD